MESSEPSYVNSMLNIIGIKLLWLGSLQISCIIPGLHVITFSVIVISWLRTKLYINMIYYHQNTKIICIYNHYFMIIYRSIQSSEFQSILSVKKSKYVVNLTNNFYFLEKNLKLRLMNKSSVNDFNVCL